MADTLTAARIEELVVEIGNLNERLAKAHGELQALKESERISNLRSQIEAFPTPVIEALRCDEPRKEDVSRLNPRDLVRRSTNGGRWSKPRWVWTQTAIEMRRLLGFNDPQAGD